MRTLFLILLLLGTSGFVQAATDLATPLERASYNEVSTAQAVSDYLHRLAKAYPQARVEQLGESARGRPIEALLIAKGKPGGDRLRVMLVGSQHGGAEPAGGEALLAIARELLAGKLRHFRRDIDFILIPDPNPDGRDAGRRANSAGVNLNTDFVLLASPEAQALARALRSYSPHVLLDSHESAVLKRKTLAREGYITDFELQFERANHPALPMAVQALGQSLLDELLATLSRAGVDANRYIGEITSVKQPVSNGGLSLRNLRNAAALNGALSFLMETRLDSREDVFDTFRNLGGRVQRQLTGLQAFLAIVHARRAEIMAGAAAARSASRTEPVTLFADYTLDTAHPRTSIRLRHRDGGRVEMRQFDDHRALATADVIPMPSTYVVVEHAAEIASVLERHAIVFEETAEPLACKVKVSRFTVKPDAHARAALLSSEEREVLAPPGSLIIDLVQARGRLAVLLLDPRSNSSIFRFPQFAAMLDPKRDFFIHTVSKGVRRQ